jgi:hypothetical protein
MKTFSELIADGTITDAASNYLAIPKMSIEKIVGKQVEVLKVFTEIATVNGSGRYLLHLRLLESGKEVKAFTNSKILKMQFAAIPPEVFPFQTTIIKYKDGNKQYFKLT